MIGLPTDFHLLRPWWLLALVALPLLWRALAQRGSDAGAWRGAVDAHLLQHLLVKSDDGLPDRWPRRLVAAGWIVASVALAGPAWERLPQPLYQNRAARVFALELSASMFAQDVKPSRYERARFKLIDMLGRSGDAQTALIAYAGDAFVVAPLTEDANTVSNLVDALDPSVMPLGGNASGRAIDLAVDLIKQAGAAGGEIILIADSVSPDAVGAAQRALNAGVRVSVLAIGSIQGAPVPLPQGGFLQDTAGNIVLPKLDESALGAVVAAGDGRYVAATADATDLQTLLDSVASGSAARARATEATTSRFQDRGPWLLLLLLPLAAFGFRRGWLMLLPLVVLAHSESAQAFAWADLWQTPEQQARKELDAGHAAQAQALAQSADLRAAAAYRAGDFAAAERDFNQAASADANYNRGNSLAKQGRYLEAIAAYQAALNSAPEMADATTNKRAIEEWLKQQQQQQDEKKKNKKSQDHQGREQNKDGSGSASDEESQNQDEQQQKNGEDRKQGDQSQQDAKPGDNSGAQEQQQDSAQQDASKQASKGKQGEDRKQNEASAREADQQAQQKYSQDMDQAAQKSAGKEDKQPQKVKLGAHDDGKPRDEHEQALEQWLERVPDDPGGLLRRKFQIEYQRRQNRADTHGGGK
jgi:Ca-activated chloride channel homolog